ncbi:MAG: monovalent cation/H(+) antiporter subunit G [Gammaproteobacteria bacterium]|jgi:multicomponent Na+:H+ antiporter subunit G
MFAIVLDILSWLLLSIGGLFVFVGGVGALRMPDLYTRMHAASVTDSIGPILIIAGIILQAGLTLASIKLAAILLFLLLTGPTASNALASAALLAGHRPGQAKTLDEESRP